MRLAVLALILGLTWFVFLSMGFLATQPAYRSWGYGEPGDFIQQAWTPRVGSIWLAEAVGAYRSVPAWTAGWFALSCLAWLAARGTRAIAPCALLGVAVITIYHPVVGVGTMSAEGPIMFWFTLAAITRKKATTWWPIIGLLAIPFKQTGIALVFVTAWLQYAGGNRSRATITAAIGAITLWVCSLAGGGAVAAPLALATRKGIVHIWENLTLMFRSRPTVWFVGGGTVLAGLVAGRGAILAAMLLIAGGALLVGNVWEPRLWVELAALSAGVLGDRGGE